jgi:hypothetical protein
MIRAGTRMPSLYVGGNSQTVSEILWMLSMTAMSMGFSKVGADKELG